MKLLLTIFISMGLAQMLHIPPIIGAMFGVIYYFKNNVSIQRNWQSFSFQSPPSAFHQNLFSLLGYLAKADGVVSNNEIRIAQNIMENLCLNYTQKASAKAAFKAGSQGLNLNNTITFLKILNFSRPDLVQRVFHYAEQITHAETHKSREQINIMNQIRFHVYQGTHENQSQSQYSAPRPTTSLNKAYSTLGIKPSMDFATMKRTYRKLVGKHHPDRQRDDAARKIAEEKIKAMQQAWNVIKAHHKTETA